MNYRAIKAYVTLQRQAEYTEDCAVIDQLYELMDAAWKELDDTDIEYLHVQRGDITPETNRIELFDSILTTIEEATMKTNNLFQSKEEFQTFMDFWKRIHRDGSVKPVRHDYAGGYYMESPLSAPRHLVFLAITGRSFAKALGRIHLDTLASLRDGANVALTFKHPSYRAAYFDFFGDSIAEEAKGPILLRIIEELDKLEVRIREAK